MSDDKGQNPSVTVQGADGSHSQAAAVEGRPMTNRRMFLRMLWGAVFRRRSRAVMAVIASMVGAATLFCLAAICIAVPQQMNDEMRSYGANLVITPVRSNSEVAPGFDASALKALNDEVKSSGSARSAAYRYENVQINSLPFVAAGIKTADVKALNHHWSVEGKWPGDGGVMLGRDAATKLDAKIGSVITMKYRPGKVDKVPASPHDAGSGGSSDSGSSGASGGSSARKTDGGSTGESGSGDAGTTDKSNGSSGSGNSDGSKTSGGDMSGMKMSYTNKDEGHDDAVNVRYITPNAVSQNVSRALSYVISAESNMAPYASQSVTRPVSPSLAHLAGTQNSAQSATQYDTLNTPSHLAQQVEWHPTAPNAGGMEFRVSGIVDTGGSEDEMVYASTADVAKMTGFTRGADVIEYSVSASDDALGTLASAINKRSDLGAKAQKVTRITASNVRIVTMLRTLFLIVTLVVLALTLVGVGTTISSIVAQRKGEIGLRKALGASSRDIAVEFTVESALYGLIGGLLGTAVGYFFARELSSSVFGQRLGVNWPLAVGSVLLAAIVAVVASLPPIRAAVRIDPAVVLREE